MDFYVGDIRMFAGNFAPVGWAMCDGSLLQINGNETLYTLIGTNFGGDGQMTFAVPDLRGRVPVHNGQGLGLPNIFLGQIAGTETVTVTGANVAAHSHPIYAVDKAGDSDDPNTRLFASNSAANNYYKPATGGTITQQAFSPKTVANSTASGGESVSVMQPYAVINFIIATQGVYPSLT